VLFRSFLYNVMNTLISISRYDMDKARELICDFNDYLRNSFDIKNHKQLVELKQEIKLIEAYLKIEKARFEERLDFDITLPESLEYLVPPLMIQPIIENAIKHGVLARPEGGMVQIKIEIKDKKIEFSIKDNGIGITAKQLNELISCQKKDSVGLINIQSRLKKLFNEELKIKSTYGIGTEITWRIPAKTRKGTYL
jgi:sensor histidine kinase YesM